MRAGLSRFVLVTLVLLAPSPALWAQHTGLPSVHTAPTFSPPVRFAPPRTPPPTPTIGRSGHWPSWTPPPSPVNRNNSHRIYPAFYAGYPWLTTFALPLGYDTPYFNDWQEEQAPPRQTEYSAPPAANDVALPPGPELAGNAPPPFRPPYEAPVEAAPLHDQPATTLIFSDGRPAVEVHNYALTGSTLYALDGDSRQEIPLSQLNIPATTEANRKAGVDFALPVAH
jgi:hypothetical protein